MRHSPSYSRFGSFLRIPHSSSFGLWVTLLLQSSIKDLLRLPERTEGREVYRICTRKLGWGAVDWHEVVRGVLGLTDVKEHMENRMHEAAAIKPVVIDEALVDFEHLRLSMELGYTGAALKTCKGQSQALLMGAAALKYGLFLCVQDLTLVGASFLHSAGMAARLPEVAAIEGNGRQYCPSANSDWEESWPDVFRLRDGTVGTAALTLPGLGHYSG